MALIKVGGKVVDYGYYCEEIKPRWKEQMRRKWMKKYGKKNKRYKQ